MKQKILIAFAIVCAALIVSPLVRRLSQQDKQRHAERIQKEAEQVDAANRILAAKIFERCDGVPELQQFVSLYKPTGALEFFDKDTMSKVVSVACVTAIDERFTASFVAPVETNGAGIYTLTGDIVFRIEDKSATFRKINPQGYSEGKTAWMNQSEWRKFMDSNADIESLRVTHSVVE